MAAATAKVVPEGDEGEGEGGEGGRRIRGWGVRGREQGKAEG